MQFRNHVLFLPQKNSRIDEKFPSIKTLFLLYFLKTKNRGYILYTGPKRGDGNKSFESAECKERLLQIKMQ